MRTDYFNEGPPWKLVFENKYGFRFTMVTREAKPPEEYEFPFVRSLPDMIGKDRPKFKKIGQLGNTVAYKEI